MLKDGNLFNYEVLYKEIYRESIVNNWRIKCLLNLTVYLLNGSTLNARPPAYLDVNTTNVLTSNGLIYGRYINEKCFNYNFRIRSKKEYLHRSYAFFESKIKNMRSF